MKVLFVIDRLELKYFEFNNLVTNFWMIKGLLERGCDVDITTIDELVNGIINFNPGISGIFNNPLFTIGIFKPYSLGHYHPLLSIYII